MSSPESSSRRDFLKLSGIAVGAAGVALSSTVHAADAGGPDQEPNAALGRLIEGNKRFVSGKSLRTGRTPKDFANDAKGQAPIAIILACADSRVAPELIFDQDVGDLFVVRVAGNVASGAGPLVKGSIEFAVAELGARLIIVLGHSECGAVKAAIEHIDADDKLPGSIGDLVDLIKPAVIDAKGLPGNKLNNVIKANVLRSADRLKTLDPILSPIAKKGELKVVGATYELKTGVVELFG